MTAGVKSSSLVAILFAQDEEQILQFHLSSLEYVGGCSLQKLSALHWDQNEALPQFGDPHLLLPSGYGAMFRHLAQGLEVVHAAKVSWGLPVMQRW